MPLLHKLPYVCQQQEAGDVSTFFFERPPAMKHEAGKHAVFMLPGLYRPHPFTLSSSPDEEYLAFTTHTATGSRFKQRLLRMKQGDTIWALGPVMNFTFRSSVQRYTLLAQGIGITPFRSMLLHARKHLPEVHTTLVHVSSGEHVFKALTEEAATVAHYPSDAVAFRDVTAKLDTSGLFYVSGSPSFVRSTKRLLTGRGIKTSAIVVDSFLGY